MNPQTKNSHSKTTRSAAKSFAFILVTCCAVFAIPRTTVAQNQTLYQFNLPEQSLGEALRTIGQLTATNVLFDPQSVVNKTAPAVRARLTAAQAIDRVLRGTDLFARQSAADTVLVQSFAAKERAETKPTADMAPAHSSENSKIARAAADSSGNMTRVGSFTEEKKREPAESSDSSGASTDSAAEGKEITVTGSRIRGLLGEQSIQPVLTITAEDIERYGVSSLGEVFRYIPQVSSFELGQEIQMPGVVGTPSIDDTSTRITATLRGAPLGGTLLLVNGRRVPKSGHASGLQSNEAYDLGGIPLSAVDRIDVLLDGASAIYGADAVGGVINVILKKNYRGTEARVNYENTFDTDVSVKTVSLTHGFSRGGFSGLLSVSWEDANSMMWGDRRFLQSFDRRPFGGFDFRFHGYDGPGVISSTGGNLPGLTTNQVAIPPGSNGVGRTVNDYANAGPLPALFDFGQYTRYSSPYERRSMASNIEYAFSRALTLFAEGRWSENRTWSSSSPLAASSALVPAGAPGNPFGVPVLATKYFFDLPAPESQAIAENRGVTVGMRGEFLQDWRYEFAASEIRTRPDVEIGSSNFNTARLAQAFAGASPPILLYDSTRDMSPNPPGMLEALTTSALDAERSGARMYDIQVDGPLFSLPGGEVGISIGMEYRDEHVDFPFPESSLSIRSSNRYTSGYFSEVRVPLVSDRQHWPLLNRLEASVAVRHDRYSDFPAATNPRYGLLYRPFKWLMLRGSRGEGYNVPTLVQLHRPMTQGGSFPAPGSILDALRGNQPVVRPPSGLAVVFRGNPDLRPERSENTTAGTVLEVPFVDGLSLSFDYYDTKYVDRVGALALADRIVLFPETVTRGPNLPGDLPGWPGPVIGYQDIAFNIAVNHIAGYDVGAKYHRQGDGGAWTLQAIASKVTRNEIRSAPNLPPTTSSATFNLPLQVTGSLFWARGAFGAGALCSYRAASSGTTLTGPRIPSAIRWDLQSSYDFGNAPWAYAGSSSWWSKAFADMRINVTIFNVFDVEPPLSASSTLPDNTVVDSRLRRYAINLIKKF